jgi:outer membrane receptor protein involved in Fe transport
MVKVLPRNLLSSLATVLLIALVAIPQTPPTGRLKGTVTDPQGAIIPGALILAKNALTGGEFRTVSNEIGAWEIRSVPSGSYTVSVTVQGFRTATFREIKVDAEATVAIVDATLQIGLADVVVVTASKFEEEVVNAPATATVISEQAIRHSLSQNVADLLRSVPGMNVIQTSAREFNVAGRTASGVLPSAQLALIDGRTIYDDWSGSIAWDGLPMNLDEVGQVEVIRGPASAVWGANAMNGVINIITKPPREMLGTTFALGIGTFNRSVGEADSGRGSLYYVNATHAQVLSDRWAFKIAGGAYTQDPFARPEGMIPNPYHMTYPLFDNKGTTQANLDARTDNDLPDGKQHFSFSGGYGSSGGIMYGGLGPWKIHPGSMKSYGKVDYVRGALRITGYTNISSATFTNLLLVDPAGQPIQGEAKTHTYDIEFGNSSMVQAKHLISYGGNFRHAGFDSSLTPGGNGRNEGGVYFQDEILASKHFRWVVGARIDKFDNLKGVVLSPRTTLLVKALPDQTFRVSYNRAYMAPSVMMNYWQSLFLSGIDLGLIDPQLSGNYFAYPVNVVGNRDLKEQSLNAYEVGYTALIAKGRASLGASFYINDSKGDFYTPQTDSYTSQAPPPGWPLPPFVLDALIAANAFGPGLGLPSLYTYGNRGRVRNKGLELSADAALNRHITGFANYSWQARPESRSFDVSALNQPPAHRFNAGIRFDYKRYLGNVSVGYVGSAQWNDVLGVLYGGPTKAYTAVNADAGVRWGRGQKYMAVVKVSNLTNTPIQNHLFGDILKRQISGEFRVRL